MENSFLPSLHSTYIEDFITSLRCSNFSRLNRPNSFQFSSQRVFSRSLSIGNPGIPIFQLFSCTPVAKIAISLNVKTGPFERIFL